MESTKTPYRGRIFFATAKARSIACSAALFISGLLVRANEQQLDID
jgi:hypothetical protein